MHEFLTTYTDAGVGTAALVAKLDTEYPGQLTFKGANIAIFQVPIDLLPIILANKELARKLRRHTKDGTTLLCVKQDPRTYKWPAAAMIADMGGDTFLEELNTPTKLYNGLLKKLV